MYLKSTKYVISISLYQFCIYALLNACSVISYNWYDSTEHVWVCVEMERVQNAHAVQRLGPNRWPGRRVPTVHATLKNYKIYRQHGTGLNRNKVNSGSIYIYIYKFPLSNFFNLFIINVFSKSINSQF